jgi:hypothetical protein
MAVFDKIVKIKRAVPDPQKDQTLPQLGALNLKSITSVTALAGTTGVDACLIQGNKWQQLNGQHTENVSQDHLLTILGNRQEMVAGNHTHTIVGNTNATHVGVHNHTNISPRNDTFVHTRTEMHSEQECQQQPTGRTESTANETTSTQNEQHFQLLKMEVTGTAIEATTLKTEYKQIAVDVTNMGTDFVLMEAESKGFHSNLAALATDIHGGKIKAAATHIKAIGGNLNAGIAGNADSPFA